MKHINTFLNFLLEKSNSLIFRKATNDDYPSIKKIANQHRNYLPFVMRVAIEDSIKRGEVIVAEDKGSIVGFIHIHKRRDGITTVHEIGVDRDYVGKGIGKKLLSMIDKPIQLKVTQDNPANDFYKKMGFKFKSVVKGKNRDLNLYLLESKNEEIDLIEDYFLEFCDDYNMDISVDKGHLVNDNYIDTKILPELLQMAMRDNIDVDLKDCYRVQLFSKEHKERNFFMQGHMPGKMPELGDDWKESINDDFNSCLNKVLKSTNLTPFRVPKLEKTHFSISFYLI